MLYSRHRKLRPAVATRQKPHANGASLLTKIVERRSVRRLKRSTAAGHLALQNRTALKEGGPA
jgi:hypothetical protein